jgi:hypothetical protein
MHDVLGDMKTLVTSTVKNSISVYDDPESFHQVYEENYKNAISGKTDFINFRSYPSILKQSVK